MAMSSKKGSEKAEKEKDHDKKVSEKLEKEKIDNKKPMKKAKKTAVRASKYTIVRIILTLINFAIYTTLDRTIFHDSENLLWLVSLISCTITAIVAYFMHSRITWRERNPGKLGMVKFMIWNILIAMAVSPFLTWMFSMITPLYQFAYNITSTIHLPFDFSFVESTGVFCLTTLCTMILNYFFYDKIVFGKKV